MTKKTILVVEDEGIVAKDIQNRLKTLGYLVPETAATGEMGLQKVEQVNPDLVLMDIMLKGEMTGIETATAIRKKKNIPIIYLTAYSDEATLEKAKITEPYGYILKPFEERELHSAVAMALHKHKIEQKLRDSEKWLKTTLSSIGDGVIATDAKGKIMFLNPAAETLTGWQQEEAISKDFKEVFKVTNEQNNQNPESLLPRVLREGVVMGLANHTILISRDGTRRPIEDSAAPIKDDDGNIIGVVLVFKDISERRLAEKKIQVLAKFPEDNPNPILRVTPDGILLYANKASLALLQEWKREINQPVPASIYKSICSVVEAQTSDHILLEIQDKLYSFMIVWFPEINSVYLYGQDITRQKMAEDALAAEKERLSITLRSIGDGVITTDIYGNIVFINTVAEKLTGWSQEDAMGKSLNDIFYTIHEKTKKRGENPVELVLRYKKIIELPKKMILIAKDKKERLIADSAAPIYDGDGNIVGVVLVFQDITERTKLELELSKSQKLESVGMLAGGIAHDFNNILTGILGNISLLKLNANPGDKQYKRICEAEKASLRAKDLTHRLLTFAKGGAPVKIATSLTDIILDTANFALAGSNVECKFSAPEEDLWPVEVDPGQLSQVINNLIINANQAMPEGGLIEIKLDNFSNNSSKLPTLSPGNYLKISIQDQGVGIAEDHLTKIFDPYFTTKEKGSGLGLAICYSIIKNHDGTILVESKKGKGTTFHFYLPVSSKHSSGVQNSNIKEEALVVGKGTVLVMDDEDIIRDVVGEMLPKLGYNFEVVRNGMEAIETYIRAMKRGRPFDIVIMDLTIPGGMGGKEAIKKLLEIDQNVKAIVSSGYSNDPIMANYREYGFCNMLVKPFQVQELAEVLKKVSHIDEVLTK